MQSFHGKNDCYMSIVSLDESKTSSKDTQHLDESSIKEEPLEDTKKNFHITDDPTTELSMKSLECKLIDCCLHDITAYEGVNQVEPKKFQEVTSASLEDNKHDSIMEGVAKCAVKSEETAIKEIIATNSQELTLAKNETVEVKAEIIENSTQQMHEIKAESRVINPDSYDMSQCDARLSQFVTIKDNIYMESSGKVNGKVNKTMKCDCKMTEEDLENGKMGCRHNCINRLLFIECSSKCRCGEFCDNQQFQRYNYSQVGVFRTEKKGFGLRAENDILPKTFIIEFVGEVLNNEQFEKRSSKYSKDNIQHHYFMALRGNAVIDATVKGNISRFINHSCDPNAKIQKWTVNGELRVGFFSIRKISRGEEITIDYQIQRYGKEAQKCYCESENCRGWIGEIRKIKKGVDVINKKKEHPIDTAKLKTPIKPVPPPMNFTENSSIRRQFRDDIKKEITKLLSPYREETCSNGKIVSEEDYYSLLNKLTFSVLAKETKHCAQSNSILKTTESVKRKTKEYIKKYMAKFEGPYQRKSDEQDYGRILSKI